ncbi:hypothetical protein [Streptomyces caelestis]|uniref:hypothetical protein n=1 Tax=Streptomyces caelestis TaxID=36816 RepID=UPI003659BD54
MNRRHHGELRVPLRPQAEPPSLPIGRTDGDDSFPHALGDLERTALRGSRIGFVLQSFHLLPYRTVEENVMPAETHRRPRPGCGPGRDDRRAPP